MVWSQTSLSFYLFLPLRKQCSNSNLYHKIYKHKDITKSKNWQPNQSDHVTFLQLVRWTDAPIKPWANAETRILRGDRRQVIRLPFTQHDIICNSSVSKLPICLSVSQIPTPNVTCACSIKVKQDKSQKENLSTCFLFFGVSGYSHSRFVIPTVRKFLLARNLVLFSLS